MDVPQILFIVGPTAVGKSAVAHLLAQRLNGEIISCDSMQVYREISIASNKVSRAERAEVPYHMIDVVSVQDAYDVVQYRRDAIQAIEDIRGRHKLPIIVGGSGLYMQVLLDGIFEGAERNESLRNQLLQEIEEKGNAAVYARLQDLDPEAALNIHPNNTKRLIRALEVLATQEQNFSDLKKNRRGLWDEYQIKLFCLDCPRSELYAVINQRVDQMIHDGLLEEVEKVLSLMPSQTADGLIGIKEMKGFINQEYDLTRAVELMKQNTRHLAKRQLTWFRKEQRLKWISCSPAKYPEKTMKEILEHIYV